MRPMILVGLLLVPGWLAAQALNLTGFAEVSYAYSRHSSGDTLIVGRLYDRLQNRFTLNAFAVVLDKPYDPAKRSAGFHVEALFGQNATVIKAGRIPTLMGLEVIETVANPNWSEGNQFVYVENFTGVGVSVETKLNQHL